MSIYQQLKLLGMFMFLLVSFQLRAEITFTPAEPVVEMEEKITLSVSGTVGELTWSALSGWIEGTGTTVVYIAPAQPGWDVVTVTDAEVNVVTVKIQIINPNPESKNISIENAMWEVFTNRDSIRAFALSKDKATLWVGTTGGLEKRKTSTGELEKVYINTDGLPSNDINALLSDEQGGIWLGTDYGGLAHLKTDGSWQVFNRDNSNLPSNFVKASNLPSNFVKALLLDEQGGIWVGTTFSGLVHFKADGSWQVFNTDNSNLPDNEVRALLSDEQGGVWVGTGNWKTAEGGLAHFQADGSWQVFNEDNSNLPSNKIQALLSDNQGGIWIGTLAGLAHLKADGSWQVFNKDNSNLPDNRINALSSDNQGGIWIGTAFRLAHLKVDGSWQDLYKRQDLYKLNTNHYQVNALLSDNQGSVWVGTDAGLAYLRSDPLWQVSNIFNEDNSKLTSNVVNALLPDDEGGIWVGTHRELAYFRKNGFFLKKNNSELPDSKILAIVSDEQGGIWIGTELGGLAHLQADGSWQVFNRDNSNLPSNKVNTLLSDGQGGIWLGTEGIAHLKSDGSWQVFNRDNSNLPSNKVNTLLSDEQGGIWIGTTQSWLKTDGGLAHLKADGSWQVFNTNNSDLLNNDVNALLLDEQGGVWVGTNGGGLAHLQADGSWQVLNRYNSNLPDDRINALFSDKQGGIWIGTAFRLAHLKVDGSWQILDKDNSNLPDNWINAISVTEDGSVWVGTEYGGLGYLKAGDSWQVFKISNLPGNRINALLSDEQGGIWIATGNDGLAHFKKDGSWQVFNRDNSFNSNLNLPNQHIVYRFSNNIEALLSDNQGGVWVGIDFEGLAHLKKEGSWQVFNTDNSDLPDDRIEALLSDEQGGVWIGTRNGGLVHLKADGSWQVFNTDNSKLPDDQVNVLLLDDQRGVWVGTNTGGLAHIKQDSSWQIFNTDNSNLPDNRVNALLLDEQGVVWIGTFKGLAHAHLSDDSWQIFDIYTYSIELRHWITALLLDEQGGIWIGTTSGLARRDRLSLLTGDDSRPIFDTDNSNLPDNFITSLLSDNQDGVWVGTEFGGLAHLTPGKQQSGKRAAIIIAGGGNQAMNTLWDTTESISTYFYKMLINRKFVNSEIYYLSSQPWADFNGDGFGDRIVDAPRPARTLILDDVKKAFEWAKEQGKLEQPLYLFFIDHGGDGKLQLAKGINMSSQELKAMLDDYQNSTGNQVVVIIEACYSGSHLPILAAPNRAIISSAKGNELAYFENEQGFSRFFTKNLLMGMDFMEAFEYSIHQQGRLLARMDERLAGSAEYVATTQSPQLDDNGDGVYNTSDGQWLKQLRINGDIKMGNFTLAVESLTASSLQSVGEFFSLRAKASTASGQIKRVWAVIRPPRINLVLDSNGTPILAYPTLELSQSEDKEIWTGTWNEAVYNGDYEISFYAKDNEGNIEMSEESVVISLNGGVETPAEASVEIVIEKDRYARGESFKFEWVEQLGWGYDLYTAVVLPDGQFITLEGPNKFAQLNQPANWRNSRKYNENVTAIDMTLPASLATGTYCLYGILSPQGEEPMAVMNKWVYSQRCFEVK
jgi:ligand-binding sensor domain-containing protein